MKKYIITLCLLMFAAFSSQAQVYGIPSDSLSVPAQLDSSLLGKSVFDALPPSVVVKQSAQIRQAMNKFTLDNENKTISGYRIRIYFSNVQGAREGSRAAMSRFRAMYPGMPANLSYDNPNFKVVVGAFRTHYEAEEMLNVLKEDFPAATIVRDKFKYPQM